MNHFDASRSYTWDRKFVEALRSSEIPHDGTVVPLRNDSPMAKFWNKFYSPRLLRFRISYLQTKLKVKKEVLHGYC